MDLMSAAKNGNFDQVFNFLQSGHAPSVTDKDNATPLYWSACHGHSHVSEILIQAGSDVNSKVTWGSTPLHAAADRGHTNCVDVLLDSGANVNAKNNRGDTALHIAAYRGHSDVILRLIKAGADITIRNEKGKTPHQEAIEGGHSQIALNMMRSTECKTGSGSPSRARRPPDIFVSFPDGQAYPDYENAEPISPRTISGPPVVLRQTSVPPPRPPITLGRSISFNGHNTVDRQRSVREPVENALLPSPIDGRTQSVGCIAQYDNTSRHLNDVNKSFSSSDYINHSQLSAYNCANESDSSVPTELSESSAYSSDSSWSTSLMTQSNVGIEASGPYDQSAHARDMTYLNMRHQSLSNRPLRTSIGSMRELEACVPQESSDKHSSREFMSKLNKQLVDSYKHIEKLSSENETLKFKCSALLSRLNETEKILSEKERECEVLRNMLEVKSQEFRGNDDESRNAHAQNEPEMTVQRTQGGLRALTEHLGKVMSEEGIQELNDSLKETVRNHILASPEGADSDIDAPYRKWQAGVDFVVLGPHPVECRPVVQGDHLPLRLSFQIKHLKSGKRLLLKTTVHRQRDERNITRLNETEILDTVGYHKHIERILHSFDGPVERFLKFIPSPFSKVVETEDVMNRSTFIVTNHVTPLTSYIYSCVDSNLVLLFQYIAHALYKLFSAINILEQYGVQHNSINEGSVFVDSDLNIVLGGFENAIYSSDKPTKKRGLPVSESKELNDYVNVEHLTRGSSSCRSYQSSGDLADLARLFQRILPQVRPTSGSRSFDNHVHRGIVRVVNDMLSDMEHLTCVECMQRLGYVLSGYLATDLQTDFRCRSFMHSRMLALLSYSNASPDNGGVVSLEQALQRCRRETEADFLCNTNCKQLLTIARVVNKQLQ
ncbi:ankycorbin-like [Mya arenaria]|uniref:ankycorbin-like n=1 Tax=Mya arenaria TaxID=6604 RepID=UPI0022E2FB9F|nr:ankycorbin-like [Mya arenaria]XP_052781512.1 ankycorbin-like [Mya arenaria]